MRQQTLSPIRLIETPDEDFISPMGYKGLAAFHKYWGKKPVEWFGYLIQHLTREGEVVLDPFLGSGLIAREALIRNRPFIGVDINPISIELAKFLIELICPQEFSRAIHDMEKDLKPKIEDSYKLIDNTVATHFLWNADSLQSVWRVGPQRSKREELEPTSYHVQQFEKYKDYKSNHIRDLIFFQNSRINASPDLTMNALFTGRALRNIDILLEYIKKQPTSLQRALLLTLTSASGQMSRMVFAISNRGKTSGKSSDKIEIGSWVIGYWRPTLHFEINVWNCFFNRAKKLIKALYESESSGTFLCSSDPSEVFNAKASVALTNDDARVVLRNLPDNSVALILTDPPHSDRIPYLELSEVWNSILGREVSFSQEIVVSNAQGRGKDKDTYSRELYELFIEAARIVRKGGIIAVLFNARDDKSWISLKTIEEKTGCLIYKGCFPLSYSAGSVVQDSRAGAMKYDYVLIYEKSPGSVKPLGRLAALKSVHGWTASFPGIGG